MLQSPPLRRRKEDIDLLVQHFLATGANAHLNRGRQISDEAIKILTKYDWPGNIRELQNTCERLQILSEGHVIMPGDIPDQIKDPEASSALMEDYDPSVPLHELERKYIIRALDHFEGNKTQAANALGITIKTLYNKLHEYGEFERYAVHVKTK